MLSAAQYYRSRVFPWMNDRLSADPELDRIRDEAVRAAAGQVIEIGFGTGLNLPHYGGTVQRVVGIEPNPGMVERAASRIAAAPFPVQILNCAAESLPLPEASFDTAVSTLTLCSVMDPGRVLGELRRVLRDDGWLLLLEHGLADEAGVARWQHRLDWLQGKLGCGCHLTRPVSRLLADNGFRFATVQQFFAPKMPRTHGWVTVGAAIKA